MNKKPWMEEEVAYLRNNLRGDHRQIAADLGRTYESVKGKISSMRHEVEVTKFAVTLPESGYPRYDKPLVREGDCVVLPDLEIPFHHAEFVNRVLDLAHAWGVTQAILAGDALHLDAFSNFECNWRDEKPGGLDEKQRDAVLAHIQGLPEAYRDSMVSVLESIGAIKPEADVSGEMGEARKVFRSLITAFPGGIDWDMGNHEGRLLRVMHSPLIPSELLVKMKMGDNPLWRAAPYYYSELMTEGGKYFIEHPSSAAESMPWKLADKFECHVLAGHSHDWSMRRSSSGRYWAIAMGHCVDEMRLPYASQRHNTRKAHCLGAVIVRGGYPWLLSVDSPWNKLKGM